MLEMCDREGGGGGGWLAMGGWLRKKRVGAELFGNVGAKERWEKQTAGETRHAQPAQGVRLASGGPWSIGCGALEDARVHTYLRL